MFYCCCEHALLCIIHSFFKLFSNDIKSSVNLFLCCKDFIYKRNTFLVESFFAQLMGGCAVLLSFWLTYSGFLLFRFCKKPNCYHNWGLKTHLIAFPYQNMLNLCLVAIVSRYFTLSSWWVLLSFLLKTLNFTKQTNVN